ncbi:MAG: bifunctional rhamnulose-1-phosphate aldolase/short-chain dehydrogenase [Chloroflexi bacterium]|nr:bifunctional rhamnulose-1-phosphate aldolase/short-chain dehydrogenase [Chloroflexota bacterium]
MVQNLWSDEAANGLDEVGLLVYRSNLLGADPAIVNKGGGNTSVKHTVVDFRDEAVRALTVKGSGSDLKTIARPGFSDLYLEDILRVRRRDAMTDEDMVEYLSHCLLEPKAPRPSIETLLHGFLPAPHVDHTHATSIIALATASNGHEAARELFGDEVVWIPYIRPGFTMAKMCADALEQAPKARLVILQNHGLLTWADSSKTCYLNNIELINRAEEYLIDRGKGRQVFGGLSIAVADTPAGASLATTLLLALRAALSRDRRVVLHHDDSPAVLGFVSSEWARDLSERGLACPDHVLFTKTKPLFVPMPPSAAGSVDPTAATLVALQEYERRYEHYFERHRAPGVDRLDPSPRVVLIPGFGMVTAGKDKRSAMTSAEFYRQAIDVMQRATSIGDFVSLTEKDSYDIEYWPLELYKLTLAPPEKELARRIAFVTGGAGAIGRAIADRFAREGAQVVVADLDGEAAHATADTLNRRHGAAQAHWVRLDVADQESVVAAFEETVRHFGGIDVVVSSAGYASSYPIEDLSVEEWRRTMDVLLTGYFLVAREAVKVMRLQAANGWTLGGSIVFIASKAGLAPARNAAAYATAKAGELHLARCLAEEAGPDGIRVNSILPDAIIRGSGLWAGQWGQARAAAHGVPVEDLEGHYRQRNALKVAVSGEDVAEAALFFASDRAAKTTGAVLGVDGGLRDGYPR